MRCVFSFFIFKKKKIYDFIDFIYSYKLYLFVLCREFTIKADVFFFFANNKS